MKGKYLTCIENAVKRKLPAFLLCFAIAITMVHIAGMTAQTAYADDVAVAKIGETEYTSLKAAVEAAGTGPTEIELVRDTVEEIKIPEYADITIDLKGNTIASRDVDDSTNAHTIENFGTLTLLSSVGEGTIDCVIHAKACVMNQPGGKVTMSGKLSLSRSNLPLPKEQERGSWYNICNRGTMIIGKDVKVINNDNRHTAVTTGFLEYKEFLEGNCPEAKLIVNGGYFKGKFNAFKVDTAGILEINDGEIENRDGVAIVSWNELKINGGTIEAKTPLNLNKYNSGGDSADPVERGITEINGGKIKCTGNNGMFTRNINSIGGARLTINDGIFDGSFKVLETMGTNSSGEHFITCYVNGGKFNSDISEYVTVSEDKCAIKGNDGYFVFEDHAWKDATCVEAKTCERCTKTQGEALGHHYHYAGITWDEDGLGATAKFVCEKDAEHIHMIDAEVESHLLLDGCKDAGGRIVIAKATYEDTTYKETKLIDLNPDKHNWDEAEYIWGESGELIVCRAVRKCKGCNAAEEESAVIESNITSTATCDENGTMLHTATFEHDAFSEQKKTSEIAKTGHKHGDWVSLNEKQHQRICENDKTHIEVEDHSWDDGAVTSAPTTASAGVKTFKCKECEATRTEAIPQLTPEITPMPTDPSQNDTEEEAKKKAAEDPKNIPAEVTAITPANTAAVVKLITTAKNDNDLKGSSYAPLKFQSKKVKNKSISLQWTKVKGANQYTIYGNECGAGKKYKKLVTVYGKTNKYTITQIVNKKLQKGKAYKFLIIAEKGDKTIAISKTIHVRTKGHKKYDNSTKVTVKKGTKSVNKVNVGKGKKMTIKAIASLPKGKALDKAHRKMRYETSNKAVATINSKGKIKGVKKGTCYIYAYSQNGVAKKIKVVVK